MNARTLLVAVRDPNSAKSALSRALSLTQSGDRVILAHARRLSLFQLLGQGDLRHAIPDAPMEAGGDTAWLQALSAAANTPGVKVETVMLDGAPGSAIAEHARSVGADLIVVAAHREGAGRELMLGSTALKILHQADCPVLVARRLPDRAYRNVVAAVDIDVASERIVDAARSMVPNAVLTILHAYRLPDEGQLRMRGLGEAELKPLREFVRMDAQDRLSRLLARAPQSSLSLQHGFAATEILDFALRERSDLVMVSRHRGSRMSERTLGSVTQYLLYSCPCDLMMVH